MDLKQTVKIALRALKTNKTRSSLTMLGVIIGVSSVILLVSLGSGLQNYVTKQFESLGANLIIIMPGKVDIRRLSSGPPNFSTSKLKIEDAKTLTEKSTLIINAMPMIFSQEPVKFNDQKVYVEIIGATEEYLNIVNTKTIEGDFFTEADNRTAKKVAVLGSKTAGDLFGSDSPVGQKIVIGNNRFTILGVLESKGGFGGQSEDERVIIPITAAQRIFSKDNINAIYAQVKNTESVDQAISETKEILLNRLKEDDFSILNSKDILGAISSILGVLTAALAGIAAISLLVGGIGIMNIMLVSVSERTREIGLRKALGATPSVILNQFLIEAIILSVIGGVIGIIFGVMPARRASKLSPIDALRYE